MGKDVKSLILEALCCFGWFCVLQRSMSILPNQSLTTSIHHWHHNIIAPTSMQPQCCQQQNFLIILYRNIKFPLPGICPSQTPFVPLFYKIICMYKWIFWYKGARRYISNAGWWSLCLGRPIVAISNSCVQHNFVFYFHFSFYCIKSIMQWKEGKRKERI